MNDPTALRRGKRNSPRSYDGANTITIWDDRRSHSNSPTHFPNLISREISKREFEEFQELIYREAGIWLSSAKVALLTGRLARRLRHHGLQSFREYYALVVESPEERSEMLDAISTNETHFFREPQHFELLKSSVFPEWVRDADEGRRNRRIRVWSAGCSTGQEPYSLAMILLEHFPAGTGWQIEIIATDISNRVLEIARKAVWPSDVVKDIPSAYLREFMMKGFGDQTGKIKASSKIRCVIQFVRLNLNQTPYPLIGEFDLIFCRNVLIYFDWRSRDPVVRRLASFLSPTGYLFVGHAESLHQMGDVLSTVVPTAYRLARKTVPANSRER